MATTEKILAKHPFKHSASAAAASAEDYGSSLKSLWAADQTRPLNVYYSNPKSSGHFWDGRNSVQEHSR